MKTIQSDGETAMEFSEYARLIKESTKEDWLTIVCWGANAGPSYRSQFTTWSKGIRDTTWIEETSHSMLATFRPNLNISIAWGLQQLKEFREDWTDRFPDKTASSDYVDFFFGNTLVWREVAVAVDGGRCMLPMPFRTVNGDNPPRITGYHVSQQQSNFYKLLNSLMGPTNYDHFLELSGIQVLNRPWME